MDMNNIKNAKWSQPAESSSWPADCMAARMTIIDSRIISQSWGQELEYWQQDSHSFFEVITSALTQRFKEDHKHLYVQIFIEHLPVTVDLREIWWGSVDWIQLAQERDKWQAVVNTVMNFQSP
jgi:hypothetical protein